MGTTPQRFLWHDYKTFGADTVLNLLIGAARSPSRQPSATVAPCSAFTSDVESPLAGHVPPTPGWLVGHQIVL